MRSRHALVAGDDPQVRHVPFGLQDRRLPLPRQVLEALSLEQRLVELAALKTVHFAERWVGDELTDARLSSATTQSTIERSGMAGQHPRTPGVFASGDVHGVGHGDSKPRPLVNVPEQQWPFAASGGSRW